MGITASKERGTYSIDRPVKIEMDERIPASKRSAYVTDAIRKALRDDAVRDLENYLSKIKLASTGGESSVEALRRVRREREDYLAARHAPTRE